MKAISKENIRSTQGVKVTVNEQEKKEKWIIKN
jgi:hypothetical protein